MNYLLAEDNRWCKFFGHRYSPPYRDKDYREGYWDGLSYKGPERKTCSLCGATIPPHDKKAT